MMNNENPYQAPSQSKPIPMKFHFNWRPFVLLNISIASAVGIFVLAAIVWAKYEQFEVEQRLGDRSVSYDYEYHFYPMNGLILLVIVFALPNLVLLIAKLKRSKNVY